MPRHPTYVSYWITVLEAVDFGARYASHARDCPTIAVYESSPKARNKLTPRYLRGECLALRVQLSARRSLHRDCQPQVVRTNPFSSFVGLPANKEFP